LKRQAFVNSRSEIWSKANTWHYSGEMSYRNFPFYFYGIGARTATKDQELLTEQYVSLRLSVERQVAGAYYLGLRLGFDKYWYKDESPGGLYKNDPAVIGKNGGVLASVELVQVYDSRNNTVYPTKGAFIQLSTGYAPGIGRKENYKGGLFTADFRKFKSFSPALVVGLKGSYQGYPSGNVPFYLLPQLGNDQLMRGYYAGRFRDRELLAFQTELRYRFISQLGVVGFLGAGMVYGQERASLNGLKPSYGIGLRYFIDTKQGLSIRLHYGVGQKLPGEKRQSGFYFSLGESF
jgi:outer membrane protein assembly factor BamA